MWFAGAKVRLFYVFTKLNHLAITTLTFRGAGRRASLGAGGDARLPVFRQRGNSFTSALYRGISRPFPSHKTARNVPPEGLGAAYVVRRCKKVSFNISCQAAAHSPNRAKPYDWQLRFAERAVVRSRRSAGGAGGLGMPFFTALKLQPKPFISVKKLKTPLPNGKKAMLR